MALMELLAEQYEKIDFTKVSLKSIRDYENKLIYYKSEKTKVTKKEGALKNQYTAEKAFRVA
jgi:hypothetical protein